MKRRTPQFTRTVNLFPYPTLFRSRPVIVEVGDARDRGLNRVGDPLLGFERRIAFSLGIDLDLDVGDVGNGVDGQFGRAPRAARAQERDDRADEPSLPDRKAYGSEIGTAHV